MRIQWKATFLVLVILVAVVSLVFWETKKIFLDDKIAFIADASMKQVAPLKRLVQDKIEEQKNTLVRLAASRMTLGPGKVKDFGGFDVVAFMQPSAQQIRSAPWAPIWIEKSPQLSGSQWPVNYETTLLRSLSFTRLKDGEMVWTRLSDPQGSPLYAVMVSVEVQSSKEQVQTNSNEVSHLPDSVDYSSNEASARSSNSQRAIVVGFASANPLTTVTEDYIGSINRVFLVDEKGYIASHVDKALIGSLFKSDELVQEIIEERRSVGSGQFQDLNSRSVIGHYERVDRTNLYAAVVTPSEAATAIIDTYSRVIGAVALGAGVLGLLAFWVFFGRMARSGKIEGSSQDLLLDVSSDKVPDGKHLEVVTSAADSSAEESFAQDDIANSESLHDLSSSVESLRVGDREEMEGEVDSQSEEWMPYQREAQKTRFELRDFGVGLSEVLKQPVLSILGHAQLVGMKVESEEVRHHAESIEREARDIKALVERLEKLVPPNVGSFNEAGMSRNPAIISEAESMKLDIQTVVEMALARVSVDFQQEEIEIKTEFDKVPRIRGSMADLEAAIVQVLENAREAMGSRAKKEFKIEIRSIGQRVFLKMTDTGIGMDRDTASRAFEPFFHRFESPKRIGLGLAYVKEALAWHAGKAFLLSVPGDGTTVTFELPVSKEDWAIFQATRIHTLSVEAEVGQEAPEPLFGSMTLGADSAPMDPIVTSHAETQSNEFSGELFSREFAGVSIIESGDVPFDQQIDDGDDDDHFVSMSIGRAAVPGSDKNATVPEAFPEDREPSRSVGSQDEVSEFHVKIRRPRKSLPGEEEMKG